jgi:hypothetical protein
MRVHLLLARSGLLSALLVVVAASCGGTVVNAPGSGGSGGSSSGDQGGFAGSGGSGGATTGPNGGGTGPGTGGTGPGGGGAGGPGGAAPGVHCGAVDCAAGDECVVCQPVDPSPESQCAPPEGATCDHWGEFPPLFVSCDGPEDCSAGERCVVVEGSTGTLARCMTVDDCVDSCQPFCTPQLVCRTLADCPPCSTGCTRYRDPSYPIDVCRS